VRSFRRAICGAALPNTRPTPRFIGALACSRQLPSLLRDCDKAQVACGPHFERDMASVNRIGISVRSCRGGGREIMCVHSESCSSVADLKQLLCSLPHSLCADPSRLVLVHKGMH
jgi:hypothetical protein